MAQQQTPEYSQACQSSVLRVRKRTLSCRVRQAAEGRDLLGDISASQSYRAQLVKGDTKRIARCN